MAHTVTLGLRYEVATCCKIAVRDDDFVQKSTARRQVHVLVSERPSAARIGFRDAEIGQLWNSRACV